MDENATPSHHAVPDDKTTFVVEYLQHPQSFFHSPSLPCPPDNEERRRNNERRKQRKEKQTRKITDIKMSAKKKEKKRKETKLRTSKLMSHTIHVWSAELVATTLSSVPLHSMLVMGARWNWKCATGLSFSNFLKSQILKLLNNEKKKKRQRRNILMWHQK